MGSLWLIGFIVSLDKYILIASAAIFDWESMLLCYAVPSDESEERF